jgi:ribosomal protein S15, bacterial/organelle
MLTKKRKNEIVKKFGKNNDDTGSTEVQVALLTERINSLTDHLRRQPKDFSSRRGLLKLVGQRRNFMDYLKKRNIVRHATVSKQLKIRIKDPHQAPNS